MRLKRGDKVRQDNGDKVMEVLAASDVLALCAHDENGEIKQSVFQVAHLRKATTQQAQQPQPPVGNGETA